MANLMHCRVEIKQSLYNAGISVKVLIAKSEDDSLVPPPIDGHDNIFGMVEKS